MSDIGLIADAMIKYYAGDVRRINHFLKVWGYAKTIGEMEQVDKEMQRILEIAALTHDIGIKNSEKKYNSTAGNYQQTEGPPEAEILLGKLGIDIAVIERVCWLIAHHHTYTDIDSRDYQILVEADFLVNADEDALTPDTIRHVRDKLFKTDTGTAYLNALYGLD